MTVTGNVNITTDYSQMKLTADQINFQNFSLSDPNFPYSLVEIKINVQTTIDVTVISGQFRSY